jgi:geranylgeranyl diphosphate synthase type II
MPPRTMRIDAVIDLPRWLETRRRDVESVLQSRLRSAAPGDDPGRLVEAMRYSLLAPGKRVRPILALAAADAVGESWIAARGGEAKESRESKERKGPDESILIAAAAVELVHCYSLVHDDLPAMDDDDFRRGQPSNHKVYGEATAILVGDALLTLAFEWLADAGERSGRPRDFGRAALALARGAGMGGMVRGQARDLGEPPPSGIAALERLHEEKTAALFRAAVEVGASAGGGVPAEIEALGTFGQRFGVAFQHADDRDDNDHQSQARETQLRVPVLLQEALMALDRLPASGGGPRAMVLRGLAGQLLARTQAPVADRTAPGNPG